MGKINRVKKRLSKVTWQLERDCQPTNHTRLSVPKLAEG
jgi:hypothetical protein